LFCLSVSLQSLPVKRAAQSSLPNAFLLVWQSLPPSHFVLSSLDCSLNYVDLFSLNNISHLCLIDYYFIFSFFLNFIVGFIHFLFSFYPPQRQSIKSGASSLIFN
jgi:hypothetical protein